ncbi:MAG: transposase [Planctomycetes bacterium]|nr:transposase [Planctomycetota bacterium]
MSDCQNDSSSEQRLRLRGKKRTTIAHHLLLHAYGHWLPNDPRGSGSGKLRQEKFDHLGAIHKGRKKVQPSRKELREFSQDAKPFLDFELFWFDAEKRQAIGNAFAELVEKTGYTVWACAILKNHVHLCVRRHRDDAVTIWKRFAEASRSALLQIDEIDDGHPVWSDRPYKVFLYSPEDIWRTTKYIEQNRVKEGLAAQQWSFVKEYDNWPFHKKTANKQA